jgi:hypothetical protein
MTDFNPSSYVGGNIAGVSFRENLAPPTDDHVCRLCGNYDHDFIGYSRMRVQDGFGSVDFYRCSRCNGSGIEPQTWFWDGTWYKPQTWFRGHWGWDD